MGLDSSKLENIKKRGSITIARCPACAEDGGDNKGEHLFINNEGRFGCVLYHERKEYYTGSVYLN